MGWRSRRVLLALVCLALTRCTRADTCGVGQGMVDDACSECADGKFSDLDDKNGCFACPAGYKSTDLKTECRRCPAGTWSTRESSACTECVAGKYSTFTYLASDNQNTENTCSQCPLGKYSAGPGSTSCTECELGKYNNETAQTACVTCPHGTIGTSNAQVSEDECAVCGAGKHADAAHSTCHECAPGKFAPHIARGGWQLCRDCASPFVALAAGAHECTVCGRGNRYINATACEECGPGTYAPLEHQRSCSPCLPGTYSNATGASACSTDFLSGYAAVTTGATQQLPCPAGSYTSGITGFCEPCASGTYQAHEGQSACQDCPSGWYTPEAGAASVASCFIDVQESIEQLAGLLVWADFRQKIIRTQVAAASIYSTGGSCGRSSFKRPSSQYLCYDCEFGKIASSEKDSCEFDASCSPTQITVGIFSTSNSAHTSAYSGNSEGGRLENALQYGLTANEYGVVYLHAPDGQCWSSNTTVRCGPGGHPAGSACEPCPGSSISATMGTEQCEPCTGGSAPSTNKTECLCPAGMYNASFCVQCSAGKFKVGIGNDESLCEPCASGHESSAGATICTPSAAVCSPDSEVATQVVGASTIGLAGLYVRAKLDSPGHELKEAYIAMRDSTRRRRRLLALPAAAGVGARRLLTTGALHVQREVFITYSHVAHAADECERYQPVRVLRAGDHLQLLHQNYTQVHLDLGAGASSLQVSISKPGAWVRSDPSTRCQECPPGHFNNGENVCTSCESELHVQCGTCSGDLPVPVYGMGVCAAMCPTSKVWVSSACSECSTGTPKFETNSSNPTACAEETCSEANMIEGESANTCFPCGSGKKTDGNSCSECQVNELCIPGRSASTCDSSRILDENERCLPCAIGKSATRVDTVTECQNDPIAFQTGLGKQMHTLVRDDGCPRGTEFASTGNTSIPNSVCTQCPSGKISTGGDQLLEDGSPANCESCTNSTSAGLLAFYPGTDACSQCPSGKLHLQTSVSNKYASNCQICAQGQHIRESSGERTCTNCSAGKSGDGVTCNSCEQGKYAENQGMSACVDCPIGWRHKRNVNQRVSQSSACEECAPGSLAQGNSTCTECPAGTIPNEAMTGCTPCPCGYNQGLTGFDKNICAQNTCPPGRYTPAGTDDRIFNCIQCPAGKYQSDDAYWEYLLGLNASMREHERASNMFNCTFMSADPSTNCTKAHLATCSVRSCVPCPRGTYHEATGAHSRGDCLGCEVGMYSTVLGSSTETDCEWCEAGTYQNRSGQSTCINCEAGKYGKEGEIVARRPDQADHCQDCPVASTSYPGVVSELECRCNAGYSRSVSGTTLFCNPCAVGTYNNATNQLLCTSCPAGKASNITASDSVVECKTCGIGKYAAEGAETCTQCPPSATTAGAGARSDEDCFCIAGHKDSSPSQTPECVACLPGEYQDQTAQTSCVECPTNSGHNSNAQAAASACVCDSGYYHTTPGQPGCTACRPGTYAAAGSTAYPNHTLADCVSCSRGKYSAQEAANDATTCQNCVAGKFSDTLGANSSAACTSCNPGKYSAHAAANASATCVACPRGSYTQTAGMTGCVECSRGKYGSDATGATNGTQHCLPCSILGYQPNTGKTACKACPSNTQTLDTQAMQLEECLCNQGYTGPDGGNCTQCAQDTYKGALGSEPCSSCPEHANSHPGAIEVVDCICKLGYGRDAAEQECTECPKGTFSDRNLTQGNIAHLGCIECDGGGTTQNTGSTSPDDCEGCQQGKYAQDGDCSECPSTTSSDGSEGIASCLCDKGYYGAGYLSATAVECTACPEGTYKLRRDNTPSSNASACVRCPMNQFSNETAQVISTTCRDCQANSRTLDTGSEARADCVCNAGYALRGAATCAACDAGEYSVGDGGACEQCSAGTFSAALAATAVDTCVDCAEGKYSAGPGSAVCTNCRAGTFSGLLGAGLEATCQRCAAGTYSVTPGASADTTCLKCAAGKYSTTQGANSSTACIDCLQGLFSSTEGASSNSTCELCVAGTYSDTLGATSSATCELCAAGKYSDTLGATRSNLCVECATGTYSAESGLASAGNCTKCPAGTFSTGTGKTARGDCTACAAGKFSTTEGADSEDTCQDCRAGTFSGATSANSSAACTLCDAGTFSEGTGKTARDDCTACAAGKFSTTEGANSSALCVNCPMGTYSDVPGRGNRSDCALCPPGRYSNATGRTGLGDCTKCTAGKFSTAQGAEAADTCADCPAGQKSSAGSSGCGSCAAGQYTLGADCAECPVNTYCEDGLLVACDDPNAWTRGFDMRTSLAECVCAGGYFRLANQSEQIVWGESEMRSAEDYDLSIYYGDTVTLHTNTSHRPRISDGEDTAMFVAPQGSTTFTFTVPMNFTGQLFVS